MASVAYLFLSLSLCFDEIFCQDDSSSSCLSQGGLAGVIFGCITGTLVATVLALFIFWRFCWAKNSSGSITEPFYYDNPQFVQNTTAAESKDQKVSIIAADDHKLAKIQALKQDFQFSDNDLVGYTSRTVKNKRLNSNVYGLWRKSTTDDYNGRYQSTESLGSIHEYFRVPLKSKDFTGLGFGVYGNMRDGIFVKNLLNKGPAKDAGKIREGDRIVGIEINFENIVLEDALTILSYASPYPIVLEVKKCSTFVAKPTLLSRPSIRSRGSDRKAHFHPLVKSQSTDDMTSTTSRSSRRKSDAVAPIFVNPIIASHSEFNDFMSTESDIPVPGCSEEKFPDASNPNQLIVNAQICNQSKSSTLIDDGIRPPVRAKRARQDVSMNNGKARRDVSSREHAEPYIQDAFPSLSHEHAMQIIRLSYEDPEVSRSAPDLFQRAEPASNAFRQEDDETFGRKNSSASSSGKEQNIENGSTTCNPLYSTSSSEDLGEFDKEQYDKLLYFQRELIRQHEELAKLGINVPFQMNNQKYSLPTGEKY